MRREVPLRTLRVHRVLARLWLLASALSTLTAAAPAGAAPAGVAVPIAAGPVPETARASLRARTLLQGSDDAPFLAEDGLRALAAWGLERIVLQNPGRMLENADGWSSRAVFHWLRDVRACQPSFVPRAEQYHAYYAYDGCPNPEDERQMAFVVARLPRSAAVVQQMWDVVGPSALAGLSPERYAASGARDTVDLLRRAYHRVVDGRDDAALGALYARVEAEACRSLDRGLLGDEAGDLDCWGATFWLRRHHEGNVAVVAGILDGIAARYAPPPPAPDAVYVQGIGVRLRSAPRVDADPVATLWIGTPCARRTGAAPGWVAVVCDGREGWVFGALVGAAPPDAAVAQKTAIDRGLPAEERLQMALRASALHPDHAYPSGLVVRTFRDVEFARLDALERSGARPKRERSVPCASDAPDDTGAIDREAGARAWQCVADDLGRGAQRYALFGDGVARGRFVNAAAREGELVVTSGRVDLETDGPSRYSVLYESGAGPADSVLAERLLELADGPGAGAAR